MSLMTTWRISKLRWSSRTRLECYAEIAKLIAEAKERITGRVNLHEVGTYSGDEDDDPLN